MFKSHQYIVCANIEFPSVIRILTVLFGHSRYRTIRKLKTETLTQPKTQVLIHSNMKKYY